MHSFRLLPSARIHLVTDDPQWARHFDYEGYEIVVTSPPTFRGWVTICLRLTFEFFLNKQPFMGLHWVIQSPLNKSQEKALRLPLRLFPFLVRSWTRLDQQTAQSLLISRLIQLAERDYLESSTRGQRDDRLEFQRSVPGKPDQEFNQILEASSSRDQTRSGLDLA